MNYYPFHLGDYAAHTAHLEPMEDLAYRRMIDLYYRTEKPLPRAIEDIARLTRLKGHEDAIRTVLDEFFDDCADGWAHGRCDDEILRMQEKQSKASASAAKRWDNQRTANAMRTHNERIADAQPAHSDGNAPNTNTNTNTNTKEERDSGTTRSAVPPPPPAFDGKNAQVLNGKAVVELSAAFELPEDWGFDAEALGFKPAEVLREAEKLRQWATAGKGKGTRRNVKGWRQTWSNWLAKAAERQQR